MANPKYWRRELNHLSATAFPRPETNPSSEPKPTHRITQHIPSKQDDGVSVSTALILAWGVVMSQYTGKDDAVFGLAKDDSKDSVCRDQVHREKAALPFRLHIDRQLRVVDALKSVGSKIIEWDAMSASSSIEDLAALGDEVARACAFRNTLRVRHVPHGRDTSLITALSNPLTVVCDVGGNGIDIETVFDPSSISNYTARMMLYQLTHAMRQVLKPNFPDATVADLMAISPEGMGELIGKNVTEPPQPVNACVHDRITGRCRSQPSAAAIDAWDGQLTYQELDDLSSRLASRLASVAPLHADQLACVLMEKSVWVPVAMHAALKAGVALLLLDPSQPLERLRAICRKAQPPLVLSSILHLDNAKGLGPPVVKVSHSSLLKEGTPALYRRAEVRPSNAVYALFTSGSTGEPKAAVIDHAAFCTGWTTPVATQLGLGSSSRVFQSASHAFAISITNYLGTLLNGGCVCVPSEEQLQNDMAGAIRTLNANWAVMTPSIARVLDPKLVPSLSALILAGEKLTPADLAQWESLERVFSLYGQSETAVAALISRKTGPQCHATDLGTVTDPYRAWIVDSEDHNYLMPPGAVGELLLEGPCLGRGYLNDAVQTDDKFIHDPIWLKHLRTESSSSYLVYKTGDLMRYSAAGTLEYVGRKSAAEVKLRGQRMDLTEVEHHLQRQYPDAVRVAAEVVVPSNDIGPERAILVGFVLVESSPGAAVNSHQDVTLVPPTPNTRQVANTAISRMQRALPSYMVPSVVMEVQSVPLTAPGKMHRRHLHHFASSLSRKALLAYVTDSDGGRARMAVTHEETIIQQACADALGVGLETVGIDTGFSTLGGDSLSARRMVSLCRQKGLSLTVADTLAHQSLAALASKCAQAMRNEGSEQKTGFGANDPFAGLKHEFLQHRPAFLSETAIEDVMPLQGAQSFEAESKHSYFVFRLSGRLDTQQLRQACEALVQTHPPLRSMLVQFRGEQVNVVLRQHRSAFTHELLPDGTDLAEWADSFTSKGIHQRHTLHKPSTQFILAQMGTNPDDSVLITRLSHTQYDGDCLAQIILNLWALYEGKPVVVTSNFKDFARRAFHQLQDPETAAYWRCLLAGTDQSPLPVAQLELGENPRPFVAQRRVVLAKVPPPGITMATVIKAAWANLVRSRMGGSNVVISQVINGRDAVATTSTEDVIGACHAIIPLCVRFSPPVQTARNLLRTLQDQYVASLRYGFIDRDYLVKNFTSWSSNPKVGFLISYQDFPMLDDLHVGDLLSQCISRKTGWPRPGDAWVFARPVNAAIEIEFHVFNNVLREEEANQWLEQFGQIVTTFLDDSNALLEL